MRCIDLGCGGGEVTFELARLAAPDGHAIGIDMDEVKLDLARAAAAECGLLNVDFRTDDVNHWNEPAAYDIVYCRFLLHHLSRPVDLLRRMWAAVKPRGAIVVEDADFSGLFSEPANPGFDFYAGMYPRLIERNGGDALNGRKLHARFLEAGITHPNVRLVQRADTGGEAKSLSLLTLEATAESIVAAKLASQDQVKSALASLAAFTDESRSMIGSPRIFQAWSRRLP